MSWDDVVRLRKEVLPHVAKLRKVLEDSIIAARKPQNTDLEVYSRALAEIKERHKRTENEVREAWHKLKFKTLDAGAAAAAGGLSIIAPPGGWAPALIGIAAAFITKMAQGTAIDLHKIVVASRANKISPLLFFDVLPDEAQNLVRQTQAVLEKIRAK